MKLPNISLLVGAYKEEDVIGGTLKHLTEDVKYPDLEIIVGVDTHEDRTLDIAKSFAKKHKNIVIDYSPVRRGMQNAMNSMLKKARGEIVVKCDADFRYINPKRIFYKVAEYFSDPRVGGILFRTKFSKKFLDTEYKKNVAARAESFISILVTDWKDKVFPKYISGNFPYLAGCDAFRKKLVPKMDPNIFNDEIEFFYEVLSKNYKVVYAKDIEKYGAVTVPNTKALYLQKRRSAYGLIKVSKKRNVNLVLYYTSIFVYLLTNFYKYNIKDIIAMVYLSVIFATSNFDAWIKSKGKEISSTKIWVRYKRT
jgi:cellulose synthase/poly-beta-1,6-N-acetylglucosamine synthase-like glycosyltransferase